MKKIFALILVVLMLVPFVVACGGNDETTTTEAPTTEAPTTEAPTTQAPTTEGPTSETPTTEAPTTEAPKPAWSSKTDVKKDWDGKTLNVACSKWYSNGAPWAMMETFITAENHANFGVEIQTAVLERNDFIKKTYGVTVNWMDTTSASMHSVLESATVAQNINYELAAPRMMNVQQIVAGGYVYDLAGRDYIDFNNTYYNDLSVKTFTAKGHTFFLTGGFSNLDKETAAVLYFNKTLIGGEDATAKLYQMVRDGKWTWNEFVALANGGYSDNGDGVHGDEDSYGANVYGLDKLFQHFGVLRAEANASTGEWELAVNDEKIDDIIAAIITANTSNWARTSWNGSWGSNAKVAFEEGRLLFYNEVVQHSDVLAYGDVGVIPYPMLNVEQGRYYAPCSNQMSIAVCVPKVTQDRNMSDYFVDVLAWTGDEYLTDVYLNGKQNQADSDVEIEMLTDYIFPNICYDPGEAVGWGSLIGLSGAYANNQNNFEQYYQENSPAALETIKAWNEAWGAYTEA